MIKVGICVEYHSNSNSTMYMNKLVHMQEVDVPNNSCRQ